MAYVSSSLPGTIKGTASLRRYETEFTGSQIITLPSDYNKIYTIDVEGQGALSEDQYNILPPNQVEILDELDPSDYIIIIYQENVGTFSGTYSKSEVDTLLLEKEDLSNKQNNLTIDGTGTKYPTVDAVNAAISSATIPDATTTVKGKVKLAGDLAGTADLPTVPGLALKESSSNKATNFTVVNDTLYPSVKATKDYVDSKVPTNYSKIVYVNSTSPTTATIFDLNNPPVTNDNSLKTDVNNLYIGTDASTWVYNATSLTYVTKAVSSSTSNFNLAGTGTDAGNTKTAAIERTGTIGIADGTAPNHAVTKGQLDTVALSGQNQSNTSIAVNTTGTIVTKAKSTFTVAYFNYVATSGTNTRAGEIVLTWNGTVYDWYETCTSDIGDTTPLLLTASVDATNAFLKGTSFLGTWSVKAIIRMI